MPLQKQLMELPFTQGVDTKTDPKVSVKPSRLENSIFAKGDLAKRPGRDPLTSVLDTGGTLSYGEALFTFNNELTRIDNGSTKGLSESLPTPAWVTKPGGQNYNSITKNSLVRAAASATAFASVGGMDHVLVGNIAVMVWMSNDFVLLRVYDVVTGTIFQTSSITNSYSNPRLVAIGGMVVLILKQNNNVNIATTTINTATPSTAPAAITAIKTDATATTFSFDAVTVGQSYALVAYPQGAAGTDIAVFAVGPTGAVIASPAAVTVAGVCGAAGNNVYIGINVDSNGLVYVVFGDNTNARTRFFILTAALAVSVAATNIVTTGNWDGLAATAWLGTSVESSAGRMTFILYNLLNVTSTGNAPAFLGKVVLNSAGIFTAFADLTATQGMMPVSGLVPYDGTFVFGAINRVAPAISYQANDLDAEAWVLDINGAPVARALRSASGYFGMPNTTRIARSYANTTQNEATLFFGEQGRFASTVQGGVTIVVTPLGLAAITITRTRVNALPIVKVGQTSYLGGGFPRSYDGNVMGEAGFETPPIVVSITLAGGAGSLGGGTYQWSFIYSWINAQGELVRSPPSIPVSKVAVANNTATIVLQMMPESTREALFSTGTYGVVTIEAYRTQVNGSVFNRVSAFTLTNATTFASAGALTLTTTDGASDATIAVGEFLYTTGGILDWEAPPPYSIACAHQQRLIVVPSDQPYTFWTSSAWASGEQVRFSSVNTGVVPADTGPLTGVASLDGKLVLLTSKAAYVTIGDGPDLLGNNQYPPVQIVAGVDAGPIPGSPVVTTPLGIIYQSVKGLTLLDRALNQQFIGADVEEFSTPPWTLKSILVHPTLQQILFQVDPGSDVAGMAFGSLNTSNGGYRLVYDYYYNQWSIDPDCGAQSAVLYQGKYTQVQSNGTCWQETPGAWTDNAESYSSVVETPWIKLDGVNGFQRIYYLEIMGNCYSDFTLKLEVAYSYSSTEPDLPIYLADDIVTLDTAAARAAGAEGFTPQGEFAFRHHLGRKCSSVKFRISDIDILGNGHGMGLTSLSLEFGVKKGLRKLPAAQTA